MLSAVDPQVDFLRDPGPGEILLSEAEVATRFASHTVGQFHDYWRGLKNGAPRPPDRQNFSPAAVPRILPWVAILEAEDGPDDRLWFRYRLTGEEMRRYYGRAIVGSLLQDVLVAEVAERRTEQMRHILQTGQAIFGQRNLPAHNGNMIAMIFGLFPFMHPPGPGQVFLVVGRERLDQAI